MSSSPTPEYIANRVIRELAELRDFERFDILTDDETRRALRIVRRLCADVGLQRHARNST